MKKLVLIFLLILFFFLPVKQYAQSAWTINNFISNIDILKTGEVKVSEHIEVDFNTQEKHGIYRDIPYVYQDGKDKLYTEIKEIQVQQDNQKAQTQISKSDNNLRIRIGDPDKTIAGEHSYQITYIVTGVIKSFKDFDELYWNVTGNGWDANILNASATINAPDNTIIQVTCFEGPLGSTNICDSQTSSNLAIFKNKQTVYPTYGLTAVVDFKKGTVPILVVEKPKTILDKVTTWPSISTFILSLLVGFGVILYLWFKYGRDYWFPGITGYLEKKSNGAIKPYGAHEPLVVEFTPPENLPPALIGVIVDERADTLDVTSTIIDLASRGFLTITEISKKWLFGKVDYKLTRSSKSTSNLLSYEKTLLTKLFNPETSTGSGFEKKDVLISEFKYKFYTDLDKVKKKLYQEVVERGYFEEDPDKVRNLYLAYGFVVIFLGLAVTIVSIATDHIYIADLGSAAFLSGIILTVFSRFMPRRTAKGRELYRRIKGYRMFIDRAENYKQKFFENKNIFTDVLPYAIVFGMTGKFAKAMKDMGIKPDNPSWYRSTHAFNAAVLTSDINSFSTSVSNAISAAPSSSGSGGGGFSGGGFGGGGGGSW